MSNKTTSDKWGQQIKEKLFNETEMLPKTKVRYKITCYTSKGINSVTYLIT